MNITILLDYLSYTPYLFIFISLSIFIGVSLLSITKNKKYFSLSLPLGVLIITTFTAVSTVNFKSVFIILIPFMLLFLIKTNISNLQFKAILTTTLHQIKRLTIPLLIIYSFNYLNSLKVSIFPYFDICRDDIFYVHISDFIATNHVENLHIDWYLKVKDMGISQYHYFEMYLNIFLFKASQLKSVTTYIQFVLPISALIYYSGLLFLTDVFNIKVNKKNTLFILLLCLLIPSIKFSITFLPIILLIYALHKELTILNLFICALLLIINPIFLILLFPIHIFYSLYIFIRSKKINKKRILLLTGVFVVYIMYVLIFKLFQGNIPQLNQGSFSLIDFINYYSDKTHYKTLFHYWFKYSYKLFTFLPLLALSLIFTLIILIVKKQKLKYNSEVFTVLLFGFIISLISSGLLHFMNESSQVFQFYAPILIFTLIPLAYFSITNMSKFSYFSIIFLLLLSIGYAKKDINILKLDNKRLGSYSKSYFENIKEIIKENPKELNVLRFLNDSQYDDAEHFNTYNSFEGYYLAFFESNYNLHTFNMYAIKRKKSLHNYHNYNRDKLLPLGYDYNYFKSKKITNKEKLLDLYMSEHQIYYFIIQKEAVVPSNINKYIKNIIVDKKSGEQFIIVK